MIDLTLDFPFYVDTHVHLDDGCESHVCGVDAMNVTINSSLQKSSADFKTPSSIKV